MKTINEFHQLRGLPKPQHPLISVVQVDPIKPVLADEPMHLTLDFYAIALKRIFGHYKLNYGQQQYDFDEGLMTFMAPHQVFSLSLTQANELDQSGWLLLIHPDFLWHTSLAKTIKHYDYFDYSVHEALFLSAREETLIIGLLAHVQQEYQSTTDQFSQPIMIAHVETLLQYADRFYHRQVLTRTKANHQLLDRFEEIVADYFNGDHRVHEDLPTVQYVSDHLHISVSYLSRLLRTLTGQTTQQHLHNKLIERAKEKLSTTDKSVGEIAYELGFKQSQSFSKLFKSKTNQSPLAFRASLNH